MSQESHVEIPDDDTLDVTADFTIEAWIKPTSYLDGGISLYGLDPHTGSVRYRATARSEHPGALENTFDVKGYRVRQNSADYKTFHAPDRSDSYAMAGNLSDILVSDGNAIYLRHAKYNNALVRQEGHGAHLFSTSRLLDQSEAHRSHWFIGGGDFYKMPVSYEWITKQRHYGFGQFRVPFGNLLVFEGTTAWGIKHDEQRGSKVVIQLFKQPAPAPGSSEPDFVTGRQAEDRCGDP